MGRNAYISKKDLSERVHGEEVYRPGHATAQSLWLGVTSGSTKMGPTMVVRTISKNPEHTWPYSHPDTQAFVRLSSKRTSQLKSIQTLLTRTRISRALCVEEADLEHPAIPALIASFSPDTLHTSPVQLLATLSKTEGVGRKMFKSVRRIVLAGEQTSARMAEDLQERLPQAHLLPEYSLIETDLITKPCKRLNGKYPEYVYRAFHPLPNIAFQIEKPDKNGVGEIVVSTPEMRNYRTGDLGRLIEEPCLCGAPETLLVEGRVDFDIVHCAGATFHAASFEKLLGQLKGKIGDYYVELREADAKEGFLGKVKLFAVPLSPFGTAADKVIVSFFINTLQVTPTRTLRELIDSSIFAETEVLFLTSLPKQAGTKKRRLRKI